MTSDGSRVGYVEAVSIKEDESPAWPTDLYADCSVKMDFLKGIVATSCTASAAADPNASLASRTRLSSKVSNRMRRRFRARFLKLNGWLVTRSWLIGINFYSLLFD